MSRFVILVTFMLAFASMCSAQVNHCANSCVDEQCLVNGNICQTGLGNVYVGRTAGTSNSYGVKGTCYVFFEGFNVQTSPHCCSKYGSDWTSVNGGDCSKYSRIL